MAPVGNKDLEEGGQKRGRQINGFMIKRFGLFAFWGFYQNFPARSPGRKRGKVDFLPQPFGPVFLPIRLFFSPPASRKDNQIPTSSPRRAEE
jgi:hypothetical protein